VVSRRRFDDKRYGLFSALTCVSRAWPTQPAQRSTVGGADTQQSVAARKFCSRYWGPRGARFYSQRSWNRTSTVVSPDWQF